MHHPHVHIILPGGGLDKDGEWISCCPRFFLLAKALSKLFHRLFLEGLAKLHKTNKPTFFGNLSSLTGSNTFATTLAPLRKINRMVCAKPPFGDPKAILAYLSRYTRRIAISNHRLVSADADAVTSCWKGYRIKRDDRMNASCLTAAGVLGAAGFE